MVETLPALPLNFEEIGARAAELARTSRSAATECAYRSDWADFSTWCDLAGSVGLPGEATTVGAYLSARAGGLKVATLNRRISAITATFAALISASNCVRAGSARASVKVE